MCVVIVDNEVVVITYSNSFCGTEAQFAFQLKFGVAKKQKRRKNNNLTICIFSAITQRSSVAWRAVQYSDG